MSGCGSASCNCVNCTCGSGCKCEMYPDLSYSEAAATTTTGAVVLGVAPQTTGYEGAEVAESEGCKCGENCKCDPCTC